MKEVTDLLAKLREHIDQKGMAGIAIPDPACSGRYLVYGSHRLLGCVVTELGLYGDRPMFEADGARWFPPDSSDMA